MSRPLIAVSTPIEECPTPFGLQDCTRLAVAYTEAIYLAGGRPAVLPVTGQAPTGPLDGFAGLVLTGGGDLDPRLYGEQPDPTVYGVRPDRDAFETALYRAALDAGMPILAICRGLQLVNVLRGGTLIQQLDDEIEHWQTAPPAEPTHKVQIRPDARLAAAVGRTAVGVNSYHHQAIRDLGAGLRVTATCGDVIEGVEADDADLIGVQWHPEQMAASDDLQLAVFSSFVEESASFANRTTKETN